MSRHPEQNTWIRQNETHHTPGATLAQTVRPWQTVTIDIVATAVGANEGTKKILTMTDARTRHVIAVPMPKVTARRIRNAIFTHLIYIYGIPEHIYSDSSKEIRHAMTHGTCAQWNIEHIDTR